MDSTARSHQSETGPGAKQKIEQSKGKVTDNTHKVGLKK